MTIYFGYFAIGGIMGFSLGIIIMHFARKFGESLDIKDFEDENL